MVEANTNARLLSITEEQLVHAQYGLYAKDSAIKAMNVVLFNKESIISLKEDIIAGKDKEITDLRIVNKKLNRKLKWTKLKWAGTTVTLTGAFFYVLLK